MISMKFQCRGKSIKKKLMKALIRLFPYQKSNRSRFSQLCSYLFYAIDYIIIICLVILSKLKTQPPLSSYYSYIWFYLMAFLSVLFIKFQALFLLTLRKISCLIYIFAFASNWLPLYFYLLGVSMIGWFCWGLTVEKRKIHFDSRLCCQSGVIKIMGLEIVLGIMKCTQVGQEYNQMYFLFLTLFWAYLDYYDIIYNRYFWFLMFVLDVAILTINIIDFVHELLNIQFSVYLLIAILSTNIICAIILTYFYEQNYQILFQLNPFDATNSTFKLLQYFLKLDRLYKSKNSYNIHYFITHHMNQCGDVNCILRLVSGLNSQLHITKIEGLKHFFRDTLIYLSHRNKELSDYLIYRYYEQSQIVINFIDKQEFFHLKEYERIIQEISPQNKQGKKTPPIILDLNLLTGNQIETQIKKYIISSLCFWKELLEYRINMERLYQFGVRQLNELRSLEKQMERKTLLSEDKRILFNSFMTYIYQKDKGPLGSNLKLVQKYFSSRFQGPPAILISAEKQKFMQIIDVNLATIKAIGYFREELIGKSIEDFWNNDLRAEHKRHTIKKSKESQFDYQSICQTVVFFTNKFGYLIMTDFCVYSINDLDGKKWCVVFESYLTGQCIFVCNQRREVVGLSEMCISLGLTTKNIMNKMMDDLVFNDAVNKKKKINIKNRPLFQDNIEGFDDDALDNISVKFISEISFNYTVIFYAFTVTKKRKYIDRETTVFNIRSNTQTALTEKAFSSINPPSFEFNLNYSSSIFTNEQQKQQGQMSKIFSNSPQQHQSSISSMSWDCDQIIQMRLFEGKIDFLQNMQTNYGDFQRIPWAEELQTYKQVNEDKYNQIKQNRLNSMSFPFFILKAFFIIVFVIILSFSITWEISNHNQKEVLQNNHKLTLFNFEEFNKMMNLGIKATSIYYQNENTNQLNEQIREEIEEIETINQEISKIYNQFTQKLKVQVNGETLGSLIDELRLMLEYFLNDQTHQNVVVILKHLKNKVYHGWTQVITSLVVQSDNNFLEKRQRNIIILGLIIGLFLLIIMSSIKIFALVENNILQLFKVFKQIPEGYIQVYIQKLQSFRNYIQMNRTCIPEDQLLKMVNEENIGQQEVKKLTNSKSLLCPKILFFSWIFIVIAFFVNIFIQENNYLHISSNYLKITQEIYDISIETQLVFITLNLFPHNITEIQFHLGYLGDADKKFLNFLKKGIEKEYFNQQIIDFFEMFTCHNSCGLFKPMGCIEKTQQILRKGIEEIFIYTQRKYDFFTFNTRGENAFLNKTSSQTLFLLNKYYVPEIGSIVQNEIEKQFNIQMQSGKILNILIYCILAIAQIVGFLSFLLLQNILENIRKMEIFLSFLPFQFIHKNHRYWKMSIEGYCK